MPHLLGAPPAGSVVLALSPPRGCYDRDQVARPRACRRRGRTQAGAAGEVVRKQVPPPFRRCIAPRMEATPIRYGATDHRCGARWLKLLLHVRALFSL